MARHPSDRLRPGFVLDEHYELLDTIGRGGAGLVYRARDTRTGREVAVKTLIGGRGLSSSQLERFRREGRIAAALDHPGIVRVHASGVTKSGPYLVYELVADCRSVSDLADELDLFARVRLVRDAAVALGFAHAHGVVHRDVKPDNLLVDGQGKLRVTDFGAALGEDDERLTRTGGMVGTPFYMAPEQLSSKHRDSLGPPVDVWGLGVVLYEVLTGARPFEGDHLGHLYAQIHRATPAPPSSINSSVPRALQAVCLKALSRDPGERYADGAALAAALDAALLAPHAGGGRGLAIALGAMAVVGLGIGVGLLVERSRGEDRPPSPPAPVASSTASAPRGAEEAYREIRSLDDPLASTRAADAWLQRYTGHRLERRVRDVRRDTARRGPLALLEDESPRKVVFLGGDLVACEMRMSELRVQSFATGEVLTRHVVGHLPTPQLVISGDRQRLVYGGSGPTLWMAEPPWTSFRALTLKVLPTRLALSHDGSVLVVGGHQGAELYSLPSGELLRKGMLNERLRVTGLSIAPSGLVAACWEHTFHKESGIYLWAADGGLLFSTPLKTKASAIAFSPRGDYLFIGDTNGSILRFSVEDQKLVDELELTHPTAFAGQLTSPRAHHRRLGTASFAFLGPERLLSASSGRPRQGDNEHGKNEACVWRVGTGKFVGGQFLRFGRFEAVDVSPDGKLVALACLDDARIEVWSTEVFEPD